MPRLTMSEAHAVARASRPAMSPLKRKAHATATTPSERACVVFEPEVVHLHLVGDVAEGYACGRDPAQCHLSSSWADRHTVVGQPASGTTPSGVPGVPGYRGAVRRSYRRCMKHISVNDIHSLLNATDVETVVMPIRLSPSRAAIARARAARTLVSVCGGRHAMGGQQFCSGGILLDMSRLDRVLDFDSRAAGRSKSRPASSGRR